MTSHVTTSRDQMTPAGSPESGPGSDHGMSGLAFAFGSLPTAEDMKSFVFSIYQQYMDITGSFVSTAVGGEGGE